MNARVHTEWGSEADLTGVRIEVLYEINLGENVDGA